MTETVDWSKAPVFEAPPPKTPKNDELGEQASIEDAPQRQRKERSDKGLPRGPRGESAPRGRRGGSLREPIGGMLVMLNLPVSMFAPTDALDNAEIEALANAIDEQQKLSPRFRKYLQQMLGVASGGQLMAVGGMVIARRAARHGLFGTNGEQVDLSIGQQLSAMTGEQANTPRYPEPQPEPESPSGIGESVNDAGIPPVSGPGWTPPIA